MKAKNLFKTILVVSLAALCSCGPEPVVDSNEYAVLQTKSPKRGVAFSFQLESDYALLAPATSWCYNWGFKGQSNNFCDAYGMEYCPMAWNGIPDNATTVLKNHPEWKVLLGYNEPNLTDQANMTPDQAAAADKWPKVVAAAKAANKKLISPAMNWGSLSGWSDGVKWLQSFFGKSNVDINDVDGIAVHIYMGSSSAALGDLDRYKVFNKPLWLTEFCNWDAGSEVAQIKFMAEMFNAMEQDPQVERYAWFTPRSSKFSVKGMALLTSGRPFELTNSGKVFVNMSSFDQNIAYPLGKRIPAEHYRACSVKSNGGPVHVNNTTDEDGVLELYQFTQSKWVDYKIDFDGQKDVVFQIRYAAASGASFELNLVNEDGTETPLVDEFSVDATGKADVWSTASITVGQVPSKEKVVRLRSKGGIPYVNWIKFTKN